MRTNPEAYFDCLQIVAELGESLGGVTRTELQRVAFLSCLLSIYTAQPVSDWGYKFANIGAGLPFSDHLVSATDFLIDTGSLSDDTGRLELTARGTEVLARLKQLQSMATRMPCVSAAAASLLALPSSVIADGLQQEPTTVASQLRDSPTMLLDEPHLQTLHAHFEALANVIPPGDIDLLSPSVLWLSYMAHVNASGEGSQDADEDVPPNPEDRGGPAGSGGLENSPPESDAGLASCLDASPFARYESVRAADSVPEGSLKVVP